MTAKTYKLTAVIANVTGWNKESQDWAGVQFAKEFDGERSIITENLTRLQLRDAITETLYLDDDYLSEESLFITDNLVSVGITENGDGFQDIYGNFLVDYTFTVTEVKSVNLQEVL